MTSPCLTDGSKSTAITAPQFTFSFQTFGAKYVSFSGNDDSLGPLNVSLLLTLPIVAVVAQKLTQSL